MKRPHYYACLMLVFLWGCHNPTSEGHGKIDLEPQSTIVNKVPLPDTPNIPPATPPHCPTNPAEYRENMGLGIMSLTIRPGDSIIFHSSPNTEKAKDLVVKMDKYWQLSVDGKDERYFSPFKYATNFENYGFKWMGTDPESGRYKIHISDNDAPYWIAPEESEKGRFIAWEDYLHYQRANIAPDNIIYTQPDEQSAQVGYPSGFYYIFEIQEMWIKIAPIDREQPSQKLEDMQTVGWTKWYCEGAQRIDILDDTLMEGYFLD